jgi:exodeoxyribonuclease VII small subunit
MAVKHKKEIPFEEALERLEAIVDRLEAGAVPLAEAVALFEEGVGLRKRCLDLLKDAEKKVRFLSGQEGEEPVEVDPPDSWDSELGEEDEDDD